MAQDKAVQTTLSWLSIKTHLDILDPELDLPESLVLLLVQVTEGELHNSSLQGVVGVLYKDERTGHKIISLVVPFGLYGFSNLTHSNPGFG